MVTTYRWLGGCLGLGLTVFLAWGQEARGPVTVVIKDGKIVQEEVILPIDPTPRIRIGQMNGMFFGLQVEGKNITCGTDGSIWCAARVDNQELHFNQMPIQEIQQPPQPLPPNRFGKKRIGNRATWSHNGLHFTQITEAVPGKPSGKPAPGEKRKLDTCRVTYIVENKDTKAHVVEWKASIDILVNGNDGALFAAPTTHPGQVLNGVTLKDKTFPEYLHVMERPNVKDPGFVAVMTLKQPGKADSPFKITLTNLGNVFNGWEAPAQQAGDSACAIYWDAKTIKPGEKREMTWAYGGGIASNPENEGKVTINLGGNFEPGKLFTLTALVEDAAPGQTLTLELPRGIQLMEGRAIQPVASSEQNPTGTVLWKARVLNVGDFAVKVHSSTGVTQIKNVSIRAN